jgi:hypothetical protein
MTITKINKSAHTGKDLERINDQRLNVGTLNFDHGHLMVVDGENITRVAGDRHQAESVTNVT